MKYINSNVNFITCLLSFIFFLHTASAEIIIWQIGDLNESCQEFVMTDKKIVDYQVPQNWDSLLNKGSPSWGEFPGVIYSKGSKEGNPQEIWINFHYLQDYGNPELAIRARIDPNTNCNLIVYKDDIFIGRSLSKEDTFDTYFFPLGYIKKGRHEKNRIRISLMYRGQTDTSVFFDTLYVFMDDTDTDKDGVSDKDEGDCYLDQERACIPIKSRNPLMIERLSLHVEKPEGPGPYLREVRFFAPDSIILPDWLQYGQYLPYEFLRFRIGGIKEKERVKILIGYTDIVYPSARFYFYQDDQDWRKMSFEIIDQINVEIILEDGGSGDFDDLADGNINSVFTLAYPENLGVSPEKRGCFLDTILWRQ